MQTWPDYDCYFCKIMLFVVTLFAEIIWSILFNLPSSLVSALCCALNRLSSRYAMNVRGWSMRALASAKFLLSWQYFYRHGDKLSHMWVLKKILFAQAPLLAIAMEICSFFRIYGASIDRHHGKMQMLPSRLQHLPNRLAETYEHERHS